MKEAGPAFLCRLTIPAYGCEGLRIPGGPTTISPTRYGVGEWKRPIAMTFPLQAMECGMRLG